MIFTGFQDKVGLILIIGAILFIAGVILCIKSLIEWLPRRSTKQYISTYWEQVYPDQLPPHFSHGFNRSEVWRALETVQDDAYLEQMRLRARSEAALEGYILLGGVVSLLGLIMCYVALS